MTNCKTCADHGVVQKEASQNEVDCPDCFGGHGVPLAKFEELQYRYGQLLEKIGEAREYIEELETERKGLKEMIRDAKARFDEVRADCGRLLDQIKSHQQHI